jgi:hypothetical protein
LRRIHLVFVVMLVAPPASAQWIKTPTAGIPRDANGKTNLGGPAPRAAVGQSDVKIYLAVS